MSAENALLTFGIGPVHEFIAAARRVADVWAGSDLLSHLMTRAIEAARRAGGEAVFPAADDATGLTGIPNRVVVRVPLDQARKIALDMRRAVEVEWSRLAEEALRVLRQYGIHPAEDLWPVSPEPDASRQTDHVFDIAWSWVPLGDDYAAASSEGARRYTASRLFRPFDQVEQLGEKCALCGGRTALPDGNRSNVRNAWTAAAEKAESEPLEEGDERFFRFDQGRLCLVCATKRLYTRQEGKRVYFRSLVAFDEEPKDGRKSEGPKAPSRRSAEDDRRRYVAVVSLDGDRMSEILALGPDDLETPDVQAFHRAISTALRTFAQELRKPGSNDSLQNAQLDLRFLELESEIARRTPFPNRPQLIYAGGDDVLVVCAPADALPVARKIRERYLEHMRTALASYLDESRLAKLTLSGAILYAHSKHPAGMLFGGAYELLTRKAKGEAGRNALALCLMKRSGVPVEVAFKWEEAEGEDGSTEPSWLERLDRLVQDLGTGPLSSRQTFNLRREEEVLLEVFGRKKELWAPWLADRLSRGEATFEEAKALAAGITPFFVHDKTEALRIVRFLGVELSRSTT